MTEFNRNARHTPPRNAGNMVWLMGQMLIIPFRTLLYGMEMLVETMRAFQNAGDRGLQLLAGGEPPEPETPAGQSYAEVIPAPVERGPEPETNSAEASAPETVKEKGYMDKDLRDDSLKLVRYKILFVKRDYEHAFPEQEALVSDNLDGTAFTAWKVAEFIQSLSTKTVEVPEAWTDYPPNDKRYRDGNRLKGFPEEDKKYLRVYYEVLERYTREKFKYEEEKIDVLKEIRDEIRNKREAENR